MNLYKAHLLKSVNSLGVLTENCLDLIIHLG